MIKNVAIGLALLLGISTGANGLFMLLAPEAWYWAVPGVTTTGPFNQHFIRDIGLIFLLLSAALLTGVARPDLRTLLWSGTAIWMAGHALFHFWEVAVGICSSSALSRDFPAVTLPALLTGSLALWALSEDRRKR
jgi:hypothetical protein